jgi:hypothetical protein
MSQAITCPHCGFTASTSKELKPRARARCPKCKQVFEITNNSAAVELPEPIDSDEPTSPPQYDVGEVFGSLKVEPDDARSAEVNADVVAYDSQGRAMPRLPELPPEPWYYGHLWTHGSLLKASADVVCAILLIMGGTGFLISIALPSSGGDGSAVGIMTVVKIVGAAIYFLFVGAIWFTLRIVAASVLLKVDSARNIRGTYFAMRYAHFVGPFGD